jgi:hypothetical protein
MPVVFRNPNPAREDTEEEKFEGRRQGAPARPGDLMAEFSHQFLSFFAPSVAKFPVD